MLKFRQLPQQFALLRIEFLGNFDVGLNEQATDPASAVGIRQALAVHLEDVSRLRTGRNFQFGAAADRGNFERRSECSL